MVNIDISSIQQIIAELRRKKVEDKNLGNADSIIAQLEGKIKEVKIEKGIISVNIT